MQAANTHRSYGLVARAFHWVVALGIITMIPLGLVAAERAHLIGVGDPGVDQAFIDTTVTLFSIHKTLGVTLFLVALARIAWALTQPKPTPVHPGRRLETFAADTTHWLLYASLVLVPLSGWVHHAATTGFAPIWLFPDELPLVPDSPAVAEFFGAWHWVFTKVLIGALLLHVAGALKHAIVDRDGTLARIVTGRLAGPAGADHAWMPVAAAAAVWVGAIALGSVLGLGADRVGATATLGEPVASEWQVTEGSLGITVTQMGTEISGEFAEWTAEIAFDPNATGATHGDVTVTVATGSLSLGDVTQQATAAPFLQSERFPQAVYTGPIIDAPEGSEADYVVDGTLSLIGTETPLDLPFTLTLAGDTAEGAGATTIHRRDIPMAMDQYSDGDSVGLEVDIAFDLTATRGDAAGP